MKDKMKKSKNRLVNVLLVSGHKATSEKVVCRALKILQKKTKKLPKLLIKTAILNSTPIFKVTKKNSKKGKRKTSKIVPTFTPTNSFRYLLSLKLLSKTLRTSSKNIKQNTSSNLAKEILASFSQKGKLISRQKDCHKEAIQNRRYLTKFYW